MKFGSPGKNRTGILVILDGFGMNPSSVANAVKSAKTPILDRIFHKYPHTQLNASETHVGLPKGFMGNSEVGHLNIGAGRVVYQDFSLISSKIEDGSFYENPVFLKLFEKMNATKKKQTLHLMGLVSDGGVHSHESHLFALLELAKRKQVSQVAIHAFLDGRDTAPHSGVGFIRTLHTQCQKLGFAQIATVMGRFYAMDRDNRWERIEKAYEAMVSAQADEKFSDPISVVEKSYSEKVTDEFVRPAVWKNYHGMEEGDGVIFFNFRADRARQISRAMTQREFDGFHRSRVVCLSGFVCMTPYEESLGLDCAYEKPRVPNTLGEVISRKGWKQLRIAETEKYAHVTYFFNGGEETVFEGEKRILVPSPRDVPTYDLKPEMSAEKVTSELIKELETGQYGFVVVNFANPDMVGHTGNLKAAIQAVETVDRCLGAIVSWVEKNNGFMILTADHGNCEMMQDANGMPMTAHTLLPVPFVVINAMQNIKLSQDGKLCDIAPTMLALWGLPKPIEMTGKSLATEV